MPGGRPIKNGVDYFPLDVVMDDKIELIEAEHGIKGFGVVIKLLQKIYGNNYFYIFDKRAVMVFSNRVNVDINSINVIINSCNEWGIFDKVLYEKYEALTSKGIQKRFFEIVKRRKNIEVVKQLLLVDIDVSANTNLVYVNIKAQSKGKESKGKEIKTPSLFEYLKTKIVSENLTSSQDKIIEFYKYRMSKPKAKQYNSEKGINGLFRDLKNCSFKNFDINECLDISMEREWQTPDVTYFKEQDFGLQKNLSPDDLLKKYGG